MAKPLEIIEQLGPVSEEISEIERNLSNALEEQKALEDKLESAIDLENQTQEIIDAVTVEEILPEIESEIECQSETMNSLNRTMATLTDKLEALEAKMTLLTDQFLTPQTEPLTPQELEPETIMLPTPPETLSTTETEVEEKSEEEKPEPFHQVQTELREIIKI